MKNENKRWARNNTKHKVALLDGVPTLMFIHLSISQLTHVLSPRQHNTIQHHPLTFSLFSLFPSLQGYICNFHFTHAILHQIKHSSKFTLHDT